MSVVMEHEAARVLPSSVQAEQAVLGGLMLAPEALAKVSDWLSPEDFIREDHRAIYRAILELTEARKPVDPVTMAEWFIAQDLGDMVGGGQYLIELSTATPSAANIVAYAEIVADKAKLRAMIDAGTNIANQAFEPGGRDTRDLIAEAQQSLAQLSGNPRIGGVKTMREVGRRWFADLQKRYEDRGGLTGLPTPWAKFNGMTGGLQPGHLIVVAGRPSMGKSAWAINAAVLNALRRKRVLFFNLEMTDVSIYNRAAAALGDVPLKWLRDPAQEWRDENGDERDYWAQASDAVRSLDASGLLVDDTPGLGKNQIIARAKREHMRGALDMVIVDHLHLMPLPGKTRETVEIGDITREFKGLAKHLGCPVVLLSQLNRSLETRTNKRPVMADLRESGNIEQDADLIVFLYRDDYYAEKDERASEFPGLVEIIIGKQREGETGKVWARDQLAFGKLGEYDDEPPRRIDQAKPQAPRMKMRGRDAATGRD